MRILITGGTGLIGRSLCQFWLAQGHELYVWSRTPEQVKKLCHYMILVPLNIWVKFYDDIEYVLYSLTMIMECA